MASRLGLLQSAAACCRGFSARRLLPLVRMLGLVALLLLPMQMRAGTADPHPHALLQLLLDARDGAIDHHTGEEHAGPDDTHAATSGSHQPDLPTFNGVATASGSMALLVALVAMVVIPSLERNRFWPAPSRWPGRMPALEPPPPRRGGR